MFTQGRPSWQTYTLLAAGVTLVIIAYKHNGG